LKQGNLGFYGFKILKMIEINPKKELKAVSEEDIPTEKVKACFYFHHIESICLELLQGSL